MKHNVLILPFLLALAEVPPALASECETKVEVVCATLKPEMCQLLQKGTPESFRKQLCPKFGPASLTFEFTKSGLLLKTPLTRMISDLMDLPSLGVKLGKKKGSQFLDSSDGRAQKLYRFMGMLSARVGGDMQPGMILENEVYAKELVKHIYHIHLVLLGKDGSMVETGDLGALVTIERVVIGGKTWKRGHADLPAAFERAKLLLTDAP
jgi:hypothetical protein